MVVPFVSLPREIGFNRFTFIASSLAERGHNVTLVTSRFSHFLKQHRKAASSLSLDGYRIVFIDEPGYEKNVSLRRGISHLFFLSGLKRFLSLQNDRYEMIYAALPMVGSAWLAGKSALAANARFVVDVQDLWPEAQAFALPGPSFFWRLVLTPASIMAKFVYRSSDAVIGVSESYLKTAKKVAPMTTFFRTIYIGTAVDRFSVKTTAVASQGPSWEDKPLELVYLGSLGRSYDLETVFMALEILMSEGKKVPNMTIIGDGPEKRRLMEMAKRLRVPVIFAGVMDHNRLARELSGFDFALNPYYRGSLQSLTNKLADYLAAGLPVLNAANNAEVEHLIRNHDMGVNYVPEDHGYLAQLLERLDRDRSKFSGMRANARAFALTHMDRQRTYTQLFELIEGLPA